MAVDQRELPSVLERVFAREDTLDACKRHDLGAIIKILRMHGVTQGQIAARTDISQGRLSEYKTGKRVAEESAVFERFATGLNMPALARKALGLAPSTDETVESRATTDVLSDSYDMQLLATEVGMRGGNFNRREMLEMAAALGTSTALARNDVWERLAYAIGHPTAIDERVVREVEARASGFHSLDEIIPARELFRGMTAHLREVSTLLSANASDPENELRSRLLVVAGESSALAAWWASDFGDTVVSRNLYETAEKAAKGAHDSAITACALAYRSYIPSTKGNHGRARALLSDALEVLPTNVSPTATAWLSARHAEESAALGDKQQALRSWGQAEEAFGIADPEDDRAWTRFFNQNRFDSCHVATYANIPGQLERAEEIAGTILSRIPPSEQKRTVIILGDIATAHLRQGHINEACRIGKSGLTSLRSTQFSMWIPRFEAIGVGVARWRNNPPVKDYLEDLAKTKRRFSSSVR